MDIGEAIAYLESQVTDPTQGLPEELFLFVSRITPLVNVELLIHDERDRTLLAWRDDIYCGKGWHLPGGIVRFKETMQDRIEKVAAREVGAKIDVDPKPLAINELMIKPRTRGHFISFLYNCRLTGSFIPPNHGLKETDAGYLRWHDTCPANLLKVHEIYRIYIEHPTPIHHARART